MNEESKKNKKIGKILLAEFTLCFVWAIFNAIVGIGDGATWISIEFYGLSAFIFTMFIGTNIIVISNAAIIIVYKMIGLIHRAYKEQRKGYSEICGRSH